MIRWALAEIRRPPRSIPRRRRSSISSVSTLGSMTTPLPITHIRLGCRIPEGTRWSLNSWPSRTMVCPALFPPWKRITAFARSASRSVIFPLPSSPHWAPTITVAGIGSSLRGEPGPTADAALGHVAVLAPVVAVDRDLAAHLVQARDGALGDLLAQLLGVDQVRGDDQRPLVLVAGVDDRVQLLEHPFARPLGAEIVYVQEIHPGQAVEETQVGLI